MLATSTARKTELMRTAVRNMSETAVNKAHELQQGMVTVQQLTSIAQNQWKTYLQQAEDDYAKDTTSVEAGHHSIGQILNDCTIKTSTLGTHWKNAQVGLQQLEKSNVEEVDNVVKTAMEANQVLSADLAQATASVDTDIENGMGSLVSTLNDSLKMDHEAYQIIQPTITLSTDAIAELQTSHCSKVADITKQADKYLHEEYMEDHPNCTTPKRRPISVPSLESIQNLQTPCFEELLQAFWDKKSEKRSRHGNGEVKQLRDARSPLTTIN